MEIGTVIILAALGGAYFWLSRKDRLSAALDRYAHALASKGNLRAYADEDPTEGLRLQRIANSLRLAESMKRKQWAGQADLMKQTWSDVVHATWDETLEAANLRPGQPGYEESKEAANALTGPLERYRKISGWIP